MKLFKIGGRRPAEDDEGWTIYSRFLLVDGPEEIVRRSLSEFKAEGGQQPEKFAEYLRENTACWACVLSDPIVSHELEHRESDLVHETKNTTGESK